MPFCELKLKQKLKQKQITSITGNISVICICLASYLMEYGERRTYLRDEILEKTGEPVQ